MINNDTLFIDHFQKLGYTFEADLYPTKKEDRPEFRVYRVTNSQGQEVVIKQFNPRENDGPQVGFLRSAYVPTAACKLAEKYGVLPSTFVRINKLPVKDRSGSIQLFEMDSYPQEVNWSDSVRVEEALEMIQSIQQIPLTEINDETQRLYWQQPGQTGHAPMFQSEDEGYPVRYIGNVNDSITGIGHTIESRDVPSEVREKLSRVVSTTIECLGESLANEDVPPLVLAHRDTGPGNFRCTASGSIALLDWEHTRFDNPLSDYVHLWLQLIRSEKNESAMTVFEWMQERHGGESWYPTTLRLCITEKILGTVNHKFETGADPIGDIVAAELELMERAFTFKRDHSL